MSRTTRVASDEFGVTTVCTSAGEFAHCRAPCAQCPWRKDAPIGAFPAQAFRLSAETARDMAAETFACHMAGADRPTVCAGFLMVQGEQNLAVRLAVMTGRFDPAAVASPVPLYASYRAMAVANGVAPDDAALAQCRDPQDNGAEVARRRVP